MDKFLRLSNLPELNSEETENMNRPKMSKEIGSVIKTKSTKQTNKNKKNPKTSHHKKPEDAMAYLVNSTKNLKN